jgi:ABC-2 type transport system ATP-binding protein
MSEYSLEVSEVSLRLGKRLILDEIDFRIRKGTVFAVVGHNGAGKTSLFQTILGLKIQNKGFVLLMGESSLDIKSRRNLGYVPERPYFKLNWTLKSFLRFHAELLELSAQKLIAEIHRVAKEVELEGHLEQSLKTFSKGMLQKTLLAQAMMGDPEIYLLDEPMSGLDPEARERVREQVKRWSSHGKTVVFSSHALEDVDQLADHVLILKNGKTEFLGTVPEWRLKR